jgi:hypothetical protein
MRDKKFLILQEVHFAFLSVSVIFIQLLLRPSKNTGNQWTLLPITVAVRSEAWVLAGWLLGSWVRIPLKSWMFVRVFLCSYRPCNGLITRPRSPTICLNSSRNLLYVRRPRSFKDCRAMEKKWTLLTLIMTRIMYVSTRIINTTCLRSCQTPC